MPHQPGRRKKGAKGKHKNPEPANNANLQTPLDLSPLETPTSTSSLTYTPSDLTPPVAALENISLASPNNHLRTIPAMPSAFDAHMYFPSSPQDGSAATADVHGKLANETPRFSRTEGVKGFEGAFNASKKLHQILGLQDPEPFVRPPEMMNDLEEKFVERLAEYGVEVKMEGMGLGGGLERTKLEGIREEAESPIKTTYSDVEDAETNTEGGLRINPPVWAARAQATTGSGQQQTATRPPTSYESDSASDTDVGDTASGYLNPYAHSGFGSSTTLAESQSSRPGSSTSASRAFFGPARDPVVTGANVGSFAQALNYGGDYGCIGAGYRPPQASASSFVLPQQVTGATPVDAPVASYTYSSLSSTQGTGSEPQRSGSAPIVLFPSPRVEALSWDFIQAQTNFGPQSFVPSGYAPGIPSATRGQFPTGLFGQQQTPDVPEITVQSPSPTKLPKSKKRAPSSVTHEQFGPPLARARAEDKTGLPTLPAESEALWKFKFSGNTHGLLTILLTWSYVMRSCYSRYPNPKTFPFNAAFPYPINPPVYQQLVSVSFYDTSVQPHKEIRFLGPGDAAEIIYGEVDTFRSEENLEAFQEQRKQNCKFEAMRRAVGLDTSTQKDSRNMPMHQRAATGEGRWAYILVNGRAATKEETPPHVMIAFHISAITDTSTCMHTILPDDHPASSTPSYPPPNPPLKRFSSLQNLISGARKPLHMHQALRSASSSELPQDHVAGIAPQEGAQTLRRTVVKLGKAGSVPLIEGYRVDVQAFRGWLDAVGLGTGKVIMWRE